MPLWTTWPRRTQKERSQSFRDRGLAAQSIRRVRRPLWRGESALSMRQQTGKMQFEYSRLASTRESKSGRNRVLPRHHDGPAGRPGPRAGRPVVEPVARAGVQGRRRGPVHHHRKMWKAARDTERPEPWRIYDVLHPEALEEMVRTQRVWPRISANLAKGCSRRCR